MLKNYIFFQNSDPFPGFIRFTGTVDTSITPDGTTMIERLSELKEKYVDSNYQFTSYGKNPILKLKKTK